MKKLLQENEFYNKRKEHSDKKINELKQMMIDKFPENVTIFVVGSLGRSELGEKSDLDLFIVSDGRISKIKEYEIYVELIKIAKNLEFPDFSNDGQFLHIHKLEDLKNFTGKPEDDSENLFTTRMLMLLESKVVFNEDLFRKSLKGIVEHYLRDKKENEGFKPFFLLNDILRYWRTLCLNYEVIRHDSSRPWRKKNVNLKYSRLITVFSTILFLIIEKEISEEKILNICEETPLSRMLISLEKFSNSSIFSKDFVKVLEFYQIFLDAKEQTNIESDVDKKKELNENAEELSNIIFSFLNNEEIDIKLRKFLVV